MIPQCEAIIVYRYRGDHEYCGAAGHYQNVCGAFCARHWPQNPPIWYANGIAFGWDKSRRDPTLGL